MSEIRDWLREEELEKAQHHPETIDWMQEMVSYRVDGRLFSSKEQYEEYINQNTVDSKE
jgi:hypothetical protein